LLEEVMQVNTRASDSGALEAQLLDDGLCNTIDK